MSIDSRKVVVVGCGFVGSSSAFALMQSKLFSEMVLIDADHDRAEGEAMDISHGMAFASPMKIYAGTYDDITDAAVIVITAGANQKPDETRLDLIRKNSAIMKSIIGEIKKRPFEGILLIVSNPVDILTYIALKESGYPANRVIGSGTVLDTARFRSLLGQYLGISPKSLHALVLGEHGDSAVVSWSTARVGAMDIEEFARDMGKELNDANKKKIAEEVVQIAYKIYHGKKATYYGIAGALSTICKAIAKDEKRVLTVSARHGNIDGLHDVCLSLPTVIGKDGVIRTMLPRLSPEEMQKLKTSAEILCGVQQQACALLKEL